MRITINPTPILPPVVNTLISIFEIHFQQDDNRKTIEDNVAVNLERECSEVEAYKDSLALKEITLEVKDVWPDVYLLHVSLCGLKLFLKSNCSFW